ncbi:hypothetical protein KIN_32880 [Litoreibacter roseus]|uniref:Glycosyltransferase RgtA/B/C/D-like domain-containing protein n=2 Tax=Litoreibacter roseus TaxID=2601869 RepID=A0A6N6JJA3_9RHOB|nr:hypothetical protein KIN_32880 [Litoreibacter roseus]
MQTATCHTAAKPGTALRALWIYIALKLAVLIFFAVNTRFVMDEFWHFTQPVWLFAGTFETIWSAKAVGYVLFFEIAHAIGWDATSMLIIGRLTMAALAIALVYITYRMARALGQDRLTALVAVALLLSISTFIERGFRLRSEPLAILLAACAVLAVMSDRTDRTRALLIAGLLSGFAFVTTQKSVYFNVALGAGLVTDALLARDILKGIKRGGLLVIGWALALAIYCIGFGGAQAGDVLHALVTGPLGLAVNGGNFYEGLSTFVLQTFTRNLVGWGLMAVGLLLIAARIFRMDGAPRVYLVHTILLTLFVFFHNQTWPYVFTMVLPFLAPYGAHSLMKIISRAGGSLVIPAALVAAVAIPSAAKNIRYVGMTIATS